MEHIENHGNSKEAFNSENLKQLKLGKNPIKRVRVLQSKTNERKLAETKFGVKDKSGNVFKYMSYGNTHHVEIIQNKKTGKIKGDFVTMMLASHRAKGIGIPKQAIIKTDHGQEWKFIMALHINDTISVEKDDGERVFYRVQKLDAQNNKAVFRMGVASTLNNKNEELNFGINIDNLNKYNIQLCRINSIGHFIDD